MSILTCCSTLYTIDKPYNSLYSTHAMRLQLVLLWFIDFFSFSQCICECFLNVSSCLETQWGKERERRDSWQRDFYAQCKKKVTGRAKALNAKWHLSGVLDSRLQGVVNSRQHQECGLGETRVSRTASSGGKPKENRCDLLPVCLPACIRSDRVMRRSGSTY